MEYCFQWKKIHLNRANRVFVEPRWIRQYAGKLAVKTHWLSLPVRPLPAGRRYAFVTSLGWINGGMDGSEKGQEGGKKWGVQNRHCVVNYTANQSSPWALLMRARQTFPSTLSNPPTVCQRGWGYGANKQFITLNVAVRTKGSGVKNKRKPITSRKKKNGGQVQERVCFC